MRYLVIVMMVPLLLGGCFISDISTYNKVVIGTKGGADFIKGCRGCGADWPFLGARWRERHGWSKLNWDWATGIERNELCSPDNADACFEAWRKISDADFCKRYSPTNELVALELKRRKLDCSKLDDSASSK